MENKWFIPNFSQCPYCKKGTLSLEKGETVEYKYHFYVSFKCKDCRKDFYVCLNGPVKGLFRKIEDSE